MSDVIDKYREYRMAVFEKADSATISTKKSLFEASLIACQDPLKNDDDGRGLLNYAILNHDVETVEKILKKIEKFQQSNKVTLQLLKDAIAANEHETLKLLREYGLDVNQLTYGRTQLAANAGIADLEACILLLKNGADITALNTFHEKTQSIFDYAFMSKIDVNDENDHEKIAEFNINKMRLINMLSVWAWSVEYKPNFSSLEINSIDPKLIKNVFVIGAKFSSYEVALLPLLGFENAFVDIQYLLDRARKDKQFNFKEMYLAIRHCMDAGNNQPQLLNLFDEIKKIWLQHQQDDDRIVLYTLFYHPNTVDSLPEKIKAQAQQQQKELEIIPSEGVSVSKQL